VGQRLWRVRGFGMGFGYDPGASEWKFEAAARSISPVDPPDPIGRRARRNPSEPHHTETGAIHGVFLSPLRRGGRRRRSAMCRVRGRAGPLPHGRACGTGRPRHRDGRSTGPCGPQARPGTGGLGGRAAGPAGAAPEASGRETDGFPATGQASAAPGPASVPAARARPTGGTGPDASGVVSPARAGSGWTRAATLRGSRPPSSAGAPGRLPWPVDQDVGRRRRPRSRRPRCSSHADGAPGLSTPLSTPG
jgi:hypothetical protein